MRKIIVGIAALAASIAVFSFSSAAPAQAGQQIACPAHAVQGGRCYYGSRRVVGYRTEMVRRPIYRTVRRACPAAGCAPVAASAPVTVQSPPPRIVEVPQQIIVRPVPQFTYLPPAQVRVAPAPCPTAPVVMPSVTRAPCGTCAAPASQIASSAPAVGSPCTGQVSGKPGVWKIDAANGRLGCWVGQ